MGRAVVSGKRERNKELVKEQFLDAARKLFSEKGLEHTTVSDIVKATDLGRGTFYNYFKDVKDIFDAIVDELNMRVRQITKDARRQADNLYDYLHDSFKAYFDFVSSKEMLAFHYKNQFYIRSSSYKSAPIRLIVKDIQEELTGEYASFGLNKELNLRLLSYIAIGSPGELFLNNMSAGNQFSNEEVADFLARLFTEGLTVSA